MTRVSKAEPVTEHLTAYLLEPVDATTSDPHNPLMSELPPLCRPDSTANGSQSQADYLHQRAAALVLARNLRGTATLQYAAALVIAFMVGCAGVSAASKPGGGYVWTGGFIVSFLFLRRARKNSRSAKQLGIAASPGRVVIGAICAAVAVIPGLLFAVGLIANFPGVGAPRAEPTSVGSCWSAPDSDGNIGTVACTDSTATYVGESLQIEAANCGTDQYVTTDGKFLCLRLK